MRGYISREKVNMLEKTFDLGVKLPPSPEFILIEDDEDDDCYFNSIQVEALLTPKSDNNRGIPIIDEDKLFCYYNCVYNCFY